MIRKPCVAASKTLICRYWYCLQLPFSYTCVYLLLFTSMVELKGSVLRLCKSDRYLELSIQRP